MAYTRQKIPAINEKIAANSVTLESLQDETKRKNKNFTKMINDNSKILKENKEGIAELEKKTVDTDMAIEDLRKKLEAELKKAA
jgi:predicted phage tail protein